MKRYYIEKITVVSSMAGPKIEGIVVVCCLFSEL